LIYIADAAAVEFGLLQLKSRLKKEHIFVSCLKVKMLHMEIKKERNTRAISNFQIALRSRTSQKMLWTTKTIFMC